MKPVCFNGEDSYFEHKPVERLTVTELIIRNLGGRRKPMPIYCQRCGKKLKVVFAAEETSE